MNIVICWLRRRQDRKIIRKGMMAGIVPVFPDLPQGEKKRIMEVAMQEAGRMLLMAWYTCDLKTHSSCTLYNEPTDEHFSLELKKIDTSKAKKL